MIIELQQRCHIFIEGERRIKDICRIFDEWLGESGLRLERIYSLLISLLKSDSFKILIPKFCALAYFEPGSIPRIR